MEQALLFDEHIAEYEEWFDKYNNVFLSEVAAILELFPEGDNLYGLEIGTGTGRFSEALGIKEGVDPSRAMREKAGEKGINVRDARAEALPFKDMSYHILGFIDKNSAIGEFYESRKPESIFYKHANFYSVEKITEELRKVGFKQLSYSQTLFHPLDEIDEMEIPKPGYGEGSFVLIKSIK
jgi:SAM-dependent methyltransferase